MTDASTSADGSALSSARRLVDGQVPPEHVSPLDVDGVRSVAVGTALWAVALVVVLMLDGSGIWTWTCLTGFGLGLLGLLYCVRRRSAMSRSQPEAQE